MEYEFTVLIAQDEDGVYIATVPALQGCHTAGDTEEETRQSRVRLSITWE